MLNDDIKLVKPETVVNLSILLEKLSDLKFPVVKYPEPTLPVKPLSIEKCPKERTIVAEKSVPVENLSC